MTPKISVIVPVYRVADFIGRCAHSLFSQTLKEGIEFIFVDDASPDDSINMLRDALGYYPQRQEQVKIIRHATNQGVATARNTGLDAAQGEYLFWCDSDDFLELNALELMLDKAQQEDADIVWCDWLLTFGTNERIMREPSPATPDQALRMMLSGAMKFNLWNKIARRQLWIDHGIRFRPGSMLGEDMVMMLLFVHAKRVAHLPKPLYHYVKTNGNAITSADDKRKQIDLSKNIEIIAQYLQTECGHAYDAEIGMMKLHSKLPYLISDQKECYREWAEIFPESNRYAMANPYLPLYTRILQWMAAHGHWWYVKLYYRLVIKTVYGRIYR